MIALMKEISGHSLPLFKFIEMFEKRFVHIRCILSCILYRFLSGRNILFQISIKATLAMYLLIFALTSTQCYVHIL